jgi:hypothetical protein
VGDDGNFIENTKGGNNPLCPCGKGIKLGRIGKIKIDGEEYQLFRCKYKTQGGCGSEYIMDKEGNLHRGTNKLNQRLLIALNCQALVKQPKGNQIM